MNKRIVVIVASLLLAGASGYALYQEFWSHEHSGDTGGRSVAEVSGDRAVTVVIPKTYVGTKAAITSYLGEIQTEKNWQIYPYRNGIVEAYLADVGETVKKWQVVARLLPAEYSADIANMIADRKSESTRSEGMVRSAELTLSEAKSRREKILKAADLKIENASLSQSRITQSTASQIEKTVIEQDAKIAKLESDLASMSVNISTQEKTVENMKKSTDASIALESDKLGLRETTVKTAVKNAHTTLFRIFYGSSALGSSYLPSQLKSPLATASNSSLANDFIFGMMSVHSKFQKIDSLSREETFVLARDVVAAIDKGLKVLDSTVVSSEYDESMLSMDKSDLIEAKTDSMNGILTILNMYEEQKSMLAKETTVSASEYSKEVLMLERLRAEKEVASKELLMAKAEKERMIADVRNMKVSSENDASRMVTTENADKIMSLSEADRMVTEAEKMLIDARSSYKAATEALSVLESAGFSNEVRAPFAGKITRRYVNAGESISMSSPLYDIVGSEGKKEAPRTFARFEIPETDLSEVTIGKEVRFYRTAEPLRKLTAKIVRISPAVGSATKGIIVEAEFAANANSLPIWSSVRVEMEKAWNMLLIPTASVVQSESGDLSVFMVDEKGIVKSKAISTERTIGLDVYVSAGISKDDMIVELPKNYAFLEDGIKVKVQEKAVVSAPSGGAPTMPEGHKH